MKSEAFHARMPYLSAKSGNTIGDSQGPEARPSKGGKLLLERDEAFMRLALQEAAKAAEEGEVPVGAIVVRGDTVISRAHNRREGDRSALAHAELLAIDAACRTLGGWRDRKSVV